MTRHIVERKAATHVSGGVLPGGMWHVTVMSPRHNIPRITRDVLPQPLGPGRRGKAWLEIVEVKI